MKRKGFKDSQAFATACTMPSGLKHQPEAEFDWHKSEVVDWLLNQPEVRKYFFDKCNTAGAIVFDQESGTWKGKAS